MLRDHFYIPSDKGALAQATFGRTPVAGYLLATSLFPTTRTKGGFLYNIYAASLRHTLVRFIELGCQDRGEGTYPHISLCCQIKLIKQGANLLSTAENLSHSTE